MREQTVIVRCVFEEEGREVQELVEEAFRLYLRGLPARRTPA